MSDNAEPLAEPTPGEQPGAPSAARGLEVARQALSAARAAASAAGKRPSPLAPRSTSTPRSTSRADRRSGPSPDDRDPQELAGVLPRLLAQRGWQMRAAVSGVLGNWDGLVGEEIAAHAQPESFRAGRLVVRTDSTAWATQLRLLTPMLIARLNEALAQLPGASEDAAVREITVKGPDGPRWRKGGLSVPGRGPRDTYG